MIEFVKGNIIESDAHAIVNTVNCVGIMGKGLALNVKHVYPECYDDYKHACEQGKVRVGKMHVFKRQDGKYIINFPTKTHWRLPSSKYYIESGLTDLVDVINELKIKSIAIPPLGCGNGGLMWSEIRQIIVERLSKLENVHVIIYENS